MVIENEALLWASFVWRDALIMIGRDCTLTRDFTQGNQVKPHPALSCLSPQPQPQSSHRHTLGLTHAHGWVSSLQRSPLCVARDYKVPE